MKGAKVKRVDDALENNSEGGWLQKLASSAASVMKKSDPNAVSTESKIKAMEDLKAKDAAAAKAKRKAEKEKSGSKKPADVTESQHVPAALKKKSTAKSIMLSVPPRMTKPVLDQAAMKALDKVLSGNENVYLYDPIL